MTAEIDFRDLGENWSKSFHGRLPSTLKEIKAGSKVPLESLIECPDCGSSWRNQFTLESYSIISVIFACDNCGAAGKILEDGTIDRLEEDQVV